jgi:HEAT repeat protein
VDSLSDSSPEVRGAAAWGLALRQQGEAFGDLLNYLQKESDPSVRKQLYEALAVQSDIEPGAILNAALKETDDEIRLTAYSAVGSHLQEIPLDHRAAVEDEIVGDLKRLAVSGGTLNVRLRAVIALRQADTEKTKQVLNEVVAESNDPRVIKATGVDLK